MEYAKVLKFPETLVIPEFVEYLLDEHTNFVGLIDNELYNGFNKVKKIVFPSGVSGLEVGEICKYFNQFSLRSIEVTKSQLDYINDTNKIEIKLKT